MNMNLYLLSHVKKHERYFLMALPLFVVRQPCCLQLSTYLYGKPVYSMLSFSTHCIRVNDQNEEHESRCGLL